MGIVLLRTFDQIRIAATLWTTSAAICGAAALAQLFFGDVIPGTQIMWGRMTGFAGHPNELGALAAIALVPAIDNAVRGGFGRIVDTMMWVVVAFIIIGVMLSSSITALLATLGSVFVYTYLAKLSLKRIIAYSFIILIAFYINSTQNEFEARSIGERLTGITQDEGRYMASVNSRLITYSEALDYVMEHPLVGAGAGTGSILESGYRVHNLWLATAYEAGILGFLGLVIMLYSYGSLGVLAFRTTSHFSYGRFIAGILASYTAFLIFSFSSTVLYSRFAWVPVFFIMVIANHNHRIRIQQRTNFRAASASRATIQRTSP